MKNRFGATDEIGVFAMSDKGLEEISNPSALFLHEREAPVSGAAVFAGIEGTRPLLVEIQALVSPSMMSTPRRATVGFDSARLAMILAVLETRAGMRFSDKEVFLNVAGGLKISEPRRMRRRRSPCSRRCWRSRCPRGWSASARSALRGRSAPSRAWSCG